MADEANAPSGDDFEERFFAGAEVVALEIPVLQETYEEALLVIEGEGWGLEEGLRLLLTLGLGYARGKQFLDGEDADRVRLAERLMNLESVAAVMKFRTFELMKDNQILDMRMGALQNSVYAWTGTARRLRAENEALKQEVVQGRPAALASPEAPEPDPAEPSRSWLHKFIQRLCRGE